MDAVQYLMYVKKMCEEYMCDDCPIGRNAEEKGCRCDEYQKIYPSDAVRIVEEWSQDNPLQTNAQKFEEVFGSMNIEQLFEITTERLGEYTLPSIKDSIWWDEPYKEKNGK